MSEDTGNQEDLSQESPEDSDLVKQLRSEIRQRNERLTEAEQRAANLEKVTTFKDLGIDPNKGVGKLFFEAYQGEVTTDAVKAAAEEYELPLGEQQAPAQQQDQQASQQGQQKDSQPAAGEAQANSAMDAAAAGATPADGGEDPTVKGHEAFEQTMRTSGNRENAMAAHFGAKMAATLDQQRKHGGG